MAFFYGAYDTTLYGAYDATLYGAYDATLYGAYDTTPYGAYDTTSVSSSFSGFIVGATAWHKTGLAHPLAHVRKIIHDDSYMMGPYMMGPYMMGDVPLQG